MPERMDRFYDCRNHVLDELAALGDDTLFGHNLMLTKVETSRQKGGIPAADERG
jgi:hypothetical protein